MNDLKEPVVSRQQRLILMASMIDADENLKLVAALGKFYAIFLRCGELGVTELFEELDDPKWSREIIYDRLERLTEAGYLEKVHYRAWTLNVDKILSLNRSRT